MDVKKLAFAAVLSFTAILGPAIAADSTGVCINTARSTIADLTPVEINEEMTRRYEDALDISEQRSTIFSNSPLFTWATESKVACAKAIGFLKDPDSEINEEQISQCECYYNRMQYYVLR